MTQHKRYTRRLAHQEMNLALDHMLSDADASLLKNHLTESSADTRLWNNMQTVDRIFSADPMLQAPPNFAAKVMAAVAATAAVEVKTETPAIHGVAPRSDLRTVIAMVLAVLAMLPIALAVMLYVEHLITHPVEFNLLLERLTWVLNAFAQAFTAIVQVVAQYAAGAIAVIGIASVTFSITTFRILMGRSTNRRNEVVYRIPVVAA